MSDRMRPIPFEKLIDFIFGEYKGSGTILGIHKNKFYRNSSDKYTTIFGERLSSPIGPAAGPNSQLSQNIVAAYLTGSRFIELKTVQNLDGEDLPVSKPCINAQDEGYNVEWSTELRVEEAYDEYIKAWFLLHILMKELELSDKRDFMFNMSVGYDLEGIKLPKIDNYINGMKDASQSQIWKHCKDVIQSRLSGFSNFTQENLGEISSEICPSITLSTLHGCPPAEIERIGNYLLKEKGLNTFIKMNPTLLGEEFVRNTFDGMGYDYISLNGHHFKNDLQYKDGIEMLKRLKKVAGALKLSIGVKLTNTLPTKILKGELPGEEMYLSGRALYPLTINLASRLAREFDGELLISYSGGADFFNIDRILGTGIQPITIATTILKPGGYERITQLGEKVEKQLKGSVEKIDVEALEALAEEALTDRHHVKELRIVDSRKLLSKLPIYDCAIAPCTIGCPINQQIPEYVSLVGTQRYDEAFKVIAIDNALPAVTGSICDHKCQYKCTRLDYDESVTIRDMKKLAVSNAQDKFNDNIKPAPLRTNKSVAILGAGPGGLAAAYFLRRNGVSVRVFEKRAKPFGVVGNVVPDFRIEKEMLERDFQMVKRQGVEFEFGVKENFSLEKLKREYDYVILAIGANRHSILGLNKGEDQVMNAIEFLENYKNDKFKPKKLKQVCVIGGGDVAMDAARAARRLEGEPEVTIVYRRTRKYMPAEREELEEALSEGIKLRELLSPIEIRDNKLICEEMELGDMDASGRRNSVPTGRFIELSAELVIAAVGEKVEGELLSKQGIELDGRGNPRVNTSCETSIENVYVGGDVKKGPSTIVRAIADGKAISKDILAREGLGDDFSASGLELNEAGLYYKKGILSDPYNNESEASRCLACNHICEICVDVCPNRANVMLEVGQEFESAHQVVHIDGMCNECGNCGIFCPHEGNPYRDKFTIFWSEEDFENSTNKGFVVLEPKSGRVRARIEDGSQVIYSVHEENKVSKEFNELVNKCLNKYQYLLI